MQIGVTPPDVNSLEDSIKTEVTSFSRGFLQALNISLAVLSRAEHQLDKTLNISLAKLRKKERQSDLQYTRAYGLRFRFRHIYVSNELHSCNIVRCTSFMYHSKIFKNSLESTSCNNSGQHFLTGQAVAQIQRLGLYISGKPSSNWP